MKLRQRISWLMGYVHKSLLPHLDECFDIPLTEQEQRLVAILEVVEIEKYVYRHAFIGMDIEAVIHPESLGAVISLLKKREMGEDVPGSAPISVKTETGAKRELSLSIFPLDEPAGASLLLGLVEDTSG